MRGWGGGVGGVGGGGDIMEEYQESLT